MGEDDVSRPEGEGEGEVERDARAQAETLTGGDGCDAETQRSTHKS
jgi:hypothetical protein